MRERPTKYQLGKIKRWWSCNNGEIWDDYLLARYIISHWHYEDLAKIEDGKLILDTEGFEGNEDIIKVLKKNKKSWDIHWILSDYTGHHEFQLFPFSIQT
jgi:hypothetical protein